MEEKPKRILSEDALAKLALAREKAVAARKHNCAVRREAKAAMDVAPSVEAPVVSDAPAPVDVVPANFPPLVVETTAKRAPARRRQKIVLYSDSDSDDEAVYIKTKRKRRSPKRSPKRSARRSPEVLPERLVERVVEPPAVKASEPPAVKTAPKVVVPHWMSY
jgi:hypothetical protein